jgi:hypothetical protein
VPCDPVLPNCAMRLRKWNFKNCARVFLTAAMVIRFYPYPLDVNHATSKKITTYHIFCTALNQLFAHFPRHLHVPLHGTDDEVYLFTKLTCVFTMNICESTAHEQSVQHVTFPKSINLIRMS